MAETTEPEPKTSGMMTAYRALAILTTLVIIVQFFLAGLGAFHSVRTGESNRFSAHETTGYIIAGLSIVLFVAALLARLGGRAVGMVAFLFVLAGPVQVLLAKAGTDHGDFWGALHGLVGALILGFAGTLIRLGRRT
jgi:predicted membrane channel-forming protein YqfA (hemolysin III family)